MEPGLSLAGSRWRYLLQHCLSMPGAATASSTCPCSRKHPKNKVRARLQTPRPPPPHARRHKRKIPRLKTKVRQSKTPQKTPTQEPTQDPDKDDNTDVDMAIGGKYGSSPINNGGATGVPSDDPVEWPPDTSTLDPIDPALDALGPLVQIAAGPRHICLRTAAGSVPATVTTARAPWGQYRQQRLLTRSICPALLLMSRLAPDIRAETQDAGTYCWGANTFGQQGGTVLGIGRPQKLGRPLIQEPWSHTTAQPAP